MPPAPQSAHLQNEAVLAVSDVVYAVPSTGLSRTRCFADISFLIPDPDLAIDLLCGLSDFIEPPSGGPHFRIL